MIGFATIKDVQACHLGNDNNPNKSVRIANTIQAISNEPAKFPESKTNFTRRYVVMIRNKAPVASPYHLALSLIVAKSIMIKAMDLVLRDFIFQDLVRLRSSDHVVKWARFICLQLPS